MAIVCLTSTQEIFRQVFCGSVQELLEVLFNIFERLAENILSQPGNALSSHSRSTDGIFCAGHF